MAQPINNHYMLTNGGSPKQATSYVVFSIDLVPDSYLARAYIIWSGTRKASWSG